IVGIPVFVFLLDILDVRNSEDIQKRTIFGRKKKVD
ncbi:TPA: AI-2E family transporter, partial [Listeria innocua]